METYVTLGNGMGGEEGKVDAVMGGLGCKIINFFTLMGRFDYLMIFEAPDSIAAGMAVYRAKAVAGLGENHSETMRAFGDADFKKFEELAKSLDG